MKPNDLLYEHVKPTLSNYEEKGRGESAAFLNWFLEKIFRLDSIDADDAICDRPNDKGIDGIYVDHTQEEIIVFQTKLKQKNVSLGDSPLRTLSGTITQLKDDDSVQKLLDGGANQELKNILIRHDVKGLISKSYKVIGCYVSNEKLDKNGEEFLTHDSYLRVFDRERIASEFIDIETEGGVDGEFRFDISYVDPLILHIDEGTTTYIFPARATELVRMEGIVDGTLFSQNVRQSLGNTKVNKALRTSVLGRRLISTQVQAYRGQFDHGKEG